MKKWIGPVLALLACGASAVAAEPAGSLTVHLDRPGQRIGPLFYGLMTEEINHSYDGGLYAELIQNRIFQDDPRHPAHWSVVAADGAAGTIAIDPADPVNGGALKASLRLDVSAVGPGQRVGVANDGYWGIPVRPDTTYHACFYARAGNGFAGPLTVAIEGDDGKAVASAAVPAVGAGWQKYSVDLKTGAVPVSTTNRFVISTAGKGSVWLSLVSLFPPTYHDRPNGLRVDLMQKLADLHPKFLRFPGGNFLEGDHIDTRFQWKQTIGPLEDRPGHAGCWGYRASDGLGLLEFLDWCEDLHMEPLLAVYCGYSLKGDHVKPGPDMVPFVREALDEIEYCTGDATTTWGARRAKDGHPAPFVIHAVEIGNEDWFDKSHTYDARFAQVFDAIKAKYPAIQCISTAPVRSRKADLVDDHDYPAPRQMLRSVDRYQGRNPALPKVFFGEWATQDGRPTPTLRAAVADAAWLTGLQRVSETVPMSCYAPLLTNSNPGGWEWPTNLIGYDAAISFGSPSYYAQQMFAANLGDVNLAADVVEQKVVEPVDPTPQGAVGVGTYKTAAEFKDVVVTRGVETLYRGDFAAPGAPKGWRPVGRGTWAVADGALRQTDGARTDAMITAGDGSWTDYTLSLKARKISGAEGFLVLVHVRDGQNMVRLNLGGWGDTRSAVQRIENGGRGEVGTAEPFTVETGRWYDIRVAVAGREVTCFIDGKVIARATDAPLPMPRQVFAAASRDDATGEVILKVVNAGRAAQQFDVRLAGGGSIVAAALTELIGEPADVNTAADPTHVAPKQSTPAVAGKAWDHAFPPNSVSVVRLRLR